MGRQVSTATAPLLVRLQTATSMRQQTETLTRTPAVDGRTRMEVQTDTAAQVTVLTILGAGEVRTRAAGHRPSAEATEEAGDPDQRVLAVGQAVAAAVAGVAAGENQAHAAANGATVTLATNNKRTGLALSGSRQLESVQAFKKFVLHWQCHCESV